MLRAPLALTAGLMIAFSISASADTDAPAIGKVYRLRADASVVPASLSGAADSSASAPSAPAHAIFRLLDTTAAGDCIIRFWNWKTDAIMQNLFNRAPNGATTAPRYFLISAGQFARKAELFPDSAATGDQVDYAPLPKKPDFALAGTQLKALGKDRSFIYSLGTNFDFIDGSGPSKMYHDIKVWVPQPSIGRGWFMRRLGFEFMFGRFRSFSTPDSLNTQYRQVNSSMVDSTLEQQFISTNSKERIVSRFDNIGITLNPMIRLSADDRKDVFFAIAGNLEWQRTILDQTITRDYSTVSDSVPPVDWPRPYDLVSRLPSVNDVSKTTTDNFYAGGGVRLMYRDDFGTLNLRMSAGYAYTMIVNGTSTIPGAAEGAFYALQADFIEYKISGVKLGTEIRGFFKRGDDVNPLRSQPRFSLYIAKEFKLEKVGELFKP